MTHLAYQCNHGILPRWEIQHAFPSRCPTCPSFIQPKRQDRWNNSVIYTASRYHFYHFSYIQNFTGWNAGVRCREPGWGCVLYRKQSKAGFCTLWTFSLMHATVQLHEPMLLLQTVISMWISQTSKGRANYKIALTYLDGPTQRYGVSLMEHNTLFSSLKSERGSIHQLHLCAFKMYGTYLQVEKHLH